MKDISEIINETKVNAFMEKRKNRLLILFVALVLGIVIGWFAIFQLFFVSHVLPHGGL